MKKVLDVSVSFGAAIVIFGAWAKITHKPYADTWLTIGLLTEAFLFCAFGIQDLIKNKEKLQSNSSSSTTITESNSRSIEELNKTLKTIFKTH